ncbi:hypothetical protein A2757_00145 [Candidatus Giovannonibacteria bacterium RIFCSPHIGHO2_01_FULL_48_47]|nr:MAG: hypothetical protein A2757_00145 [Candidatus Giovannonibacteria bacterium RIFCSPHIGHO2_01_FULL_48_47]OGF68573.1 MAG: hypothetical protein A3D61_03905 [Candidatus Giovannonibacteria bacterium RIFCSPHIGHO2_02_FULL_48_15]OGF90029.1 MAG: hypothetical protein A3B26_00185 [Candidatus Giovannonibacteria bacterium RIFCSPLOWO2_01_FULL_48_47]OGF94699.1 MAG: hypothetical protein A2433_03545 [Candidatus Giovannonibacteria bacterium RIFOXYC1_FULL_48_8]OGF96249.1 MAG: hypothetical protein A2613_01615
MNPKGFVNIIVFGIVAVLIIGFSLFWFFRGDIIDLFSPAERQMRRDMQARDQLYENCARTEFPISDNSSLDPKKRIYTIYYWDEKLQDNAKIELPFEPETGFTGCSKKAKAILRHVQEDYERMIRESEAARGTVTGKVAIGPLCPVEPCPESVPNPYSSRQIILEPEKGGQLGKPIYIKISSDGGFQSLVPTGSYKLTITDCDFLGCNYALPKTITVEANKSIEVNIDIDTGIR